jgi:hypothetical protein
MDLAIYITLQVPQRLYPQCQSCFSRQGMAVKLGIHVPVFHLSFRVYHLAPAFALLALKNQDIDNVFDVLAEDLMSFSKKLPKTFKRWT